MVIHLNTKYKIMIILCIFIAGILSYKTVHCFMSHNRFCDIYIRNSDNKKIGLNIEIAEGEENLIKGLMFRKHLNADSGMLFVFDREQKLNFWMKNTYIPLSIAYIDSNGVINEIYDMEPLDASITYPSKQKAGYALEVNMGWFKSKNISAGCRLYFNGCVGK
jgi:uncharacterized protein